jgi:twitching motility protein PilU
MILDKLFQLMAEKQASDIFISAGAPIHIKIQGNTMPVNQQVMDRHDREDRLRTDVAEQIKTFEATMEMNLSFGVPKSATSGSTSSASAARSDRRALHPRQHPGARFAGLPPVLADLIMEKRGLILIVGATGSGKSTTIASMLDHRNANRSGHILTVEDPIEFLFKHKKSIVNQREIGMDTLDWESR